MQQSQKSLQHHLVRNLVTGFLGIVMLLSILTVLIGSSLFVQYNLDRVAHTYSIPLSSEALHCSQACRVSLSGQ